MSAITISRVYAREVIDSRGNPTIEVELDLSDGSTGHALVPSGASKGVHEALELRDGDKKRFNGKGTLTAVSRVNKEIAALLIGTPASDLFTIDKKVIAADGTEQKEKFGANAILGVSLAYANALAASQKQPLYKLVSQWMGTSPALPVPLMNIVNGGVHANNGLEIQEFMIVPHGFSNFKDAFRAGCEIFHALKDDLHKKGQSTAVGDEGGFAPALRSNVEALDFISAAIERAGYKLGTQVALALDVAASSFFDEGSNTYVMRYGGREKQDVGQMIDFYSELLGKYPIVSIEDPLQEIDWGGWKKITEKLGSKVQLVGDDLFVTQEKYVRKGVESQTANAVLIKVNQVGSLSETVNTMKYCNQKNYRTIVSHRSGETEDVTIAHLAVGSGCGQIKTGSASRSERIAKYNELLRIEDRDSALKFSQFPLKSR